MKIVNCLNLNVYIVEKFHSRSTRMNELISSEIALELVKLKIDINIGDIFRHKDNYYGYQIVIGFEYKHPYDIEKNPKVLYVILRSVNDSNDDYDHKSEIKEFIGERKKYIKLYDTIEKVEADAVAMFMGEEVVESEDTSEDTSEETNALTTSGKSVRDLEALERELQVKNDKIILLKCIVESRTNALRHVASKMQDQLHYVSRVLRTFENYLGVYEEIELIKDGEPAILSTPITIRQLVLYMDEEVGSVEIKNGQMGINFERITEFDDWIVKDDHYKILVPEERCIVAIRPSKQFRDYKDDIFGQRAKEDKIVYLLMRNGEKLYRVYTVVNLYKERLFPTYDEYEGILKEMEKNDRAKYDELDWKEVALLLQGLIDRTEVMIPHYPEINLFDTATFDNGVVQMIRDAEQLNLPDGRMLYEDWKKDINSRVKRGSRIAVSYIKDYRWDKDYGQSWCRSHFRGNYVHGYPPSPKEGVYKIHDVENVKHWNERSGIELKILYNPGDTVWYRDEDGYIDSKKRERKVAFYIEDSAEYYLNYDEISLEDADYYIGNRLDRRNYQNMLPVLYRIRLERMKELEEEKTFIKYFAEQNSYSEDKVLEAVNWWKFKNIWKRPITEDDAKAWRMIRRYLKKESVEE